MLVFHFERSNVLNELSESAVGCHVLINEIVIVQLLYYRMKKNRKNTHVTHFCTIAFYGKCLKD